MGSNVFAQPSFVTGPNDNLITVDVFSGTASGIVNSIASLAAQYDVDLIGMLRAGAAAAQVLPIVEGIANGKLLLNPQNAIARLLTASNLLVGAVGGTVTAAFNGLSTGLQSAIGAAGQVLGSVEATVGGVVSTIANGAVSDIAGLGSIINSFAGSAEFMMVDNQALIGMAVGVINSAAKYGVSGAFAAMTRTITSPYVLNGIIQQTMPNLVVASDLNSLQSLTAVAGPQGVAAVNPNFLSDFTTSYNSNGTGASTQQGMPNNDAANWSAIQDCYNQANPGWNIASRVGDSDGSSTIDLTSLQGGTDDFNSALAAGVYASANTTPGATPTDTTTPFYALASVYPQTDPNQQLADMYPNTYIDPALRSTQQPVEPTQLQTGAGAAVSAATSTTAVTPGSGTLGTYDPVTQLGTRADGSISTKQYEAEQAAGYNSGAIVFDDSPPANDRVGAQPNPATYQSTTGTASTTSNTAVNWSNNNSDPNDALFQELVGVAQGN
jgi:hypothetical protein